MTKLIPIPIPDIGSFDSVEVIEVMVKVGDSIKKEDSLIVVESEKASMDIPSPFDGIVEEIKVNANQRKIYLTGSPYLHHLCRYGISSRSTDKFMFRISPR